MILTTRQHRLFQLTVSLNNPSRLEIIKQLSLTTKWSPRFRRGCWGSMLVSAATSRWLPLAPRRIYFPCSLILPLLWHNQITIQLWNDFHDLFTGVVIKLTRNISRTTLELMFASVQVWQTTRLHELLHRPSWGHHFVGAPGWRSYFLLTWLLY